MSESLYLVVKVSKRAKKMPKRTKNWTPNAYSKNFLEKPGMIPSFGFFSIFLAPFDTFTTRYDHSHIKSEFSGYFYLYKHFI